MRQNKLRSIALAFVSVFVVLLSSTTAMSAEAKPEAKFDPRLIRDQWLAAAKLVANESGDPRAQTLLTFLSEHSVLAVGATVPSGEPALRVLESPKSEKGEWFILAVVSDEERNKPAWKKEFQSSLASSYSSESHAIAVGDARHYTSLTAGLVLLHAVDNAYRRLVEHRSEGVKEEMEIYSWEAKLLEKIGGKPYQKVLADIESWVAKTTVVKNGKLVSAEPAPAYDVRLDKVFGPSQGDVERNLRMALVSTAAFYKFFDQQGAAALDLKLFWTKLQYR